MLIIPNTRVIIIIFVGCSGGKSKLKRRCSVLIGLIEWYTGTG